MTSSSSGTGLGGFPERSANSLLNLSQTCVDARIQRGWPTARLLSLLAMPHKGALPLPATSTRQRRCLHVLRCTALVLTVVLVSMSYLQYSSWHVCPRPVLSLPSDTHSSIPEALQRTWATNSPYYPAAEYVPPPDGCVINQVRRL